ncbi:Uncharacterised protein [Candidatus Tiddalikarchaeum anstoanum]|nr:Uncharacterised protein [Candidatus Tiddalikarchaeum anstoanum]
MDIITENSFRALETILAAKNNEVPNEVVEHWGVKIKKNTFDYLLTTGFVNNKGVVELIHFSEKDSARKINSYLKCKIGVSGFGLLENDGSLKVTYIENCGGDMNLSEKQPKFWADYAERRNAQAIVYFIPDMSNFLLNDDIERFADCAAEVGKRSIYMLAIPTPISSFDKEVVIFKNPFNTFTFDVFTGVHNEYRIKVKESTSEES